MSTPGTPDPQEIAAVRSQLPANAQFDDPTWARDIIDALDAVRARVTSTCAPPQMDVTPSPSVVSNASGRLAGLALEMPSEWHGQGALHAAIDVLDAVCKNNDHRSNLGSLPSPSVMDTAREIVKATFPTQTGHPPVDQYDAMKIIASALQRERDAAYKRGAVAMREAEAPPQEIDAVRARQKRELDLLQDEVFDCLQGGKVPAPSPSVMETAREVLNAWPMERITFDELTPLIAAALQREREAGMKEALLANECAAAFHDAVVRSCDEKLVEMKHRIRELEKERDAAYEQGAVAMREACMDHLRGAWRKSGRIGLVLSLVEALRALPIPPPPADGPFDKSSGEPDAYDEAKG